MRIDTSLISDRRFAGEDWSSIAIVSIVQPGVGQLSGYMFMPDGKSKPAAPRNGELHVMFEDLQSVMMVDGKRPWKSALFQIKRDGLKFSVDFEYYDPLRWKASPENIELVIEALRPR
jgi:hypothetical protein